MTTYLHIFAYLNLVDVFLLFDLTFSFFFKFFEIVLRLTSKLLDS